jgi:hypothetical protein
VSRSPDLIRSMPIGQNMPKNTVNLGFDDLERESIFARKNKFFFYSKISYRDVFSPSEERFSEICMEVIFDGTVRTAKNGEPVATNFPIKQMTHQAA